jgi:Fur family ferric uptake transcriptional regulator
MSCGDRLVVELRQRGFRVTPQRTVILETIAHKDGHLSVQEVFVEARERLPGLNIATVYRTLDSLHQAGMIDLFYSQSEPSRFALRDPDNPHGHLVCTGCERIIEIGTALIADVARQVELETSFSIATDHLTLLGQCERCKEEDHTGPNKSNE